MLLYCLIVDITMTSKMASLGIVLALTTLGDGSCAKKSWKNVLIIRFVRVRDWLQGGTAKSSPPANNASSTASTTATAPFVVGFWQGGVLVV